MDPTVARKKTVSFVFKVVGKMFALLGWSENPLRLNLKCEPAHAEALRTIYPSVIPGYHMNKRHWNTVIFDGTIPEEEVRKMIDDSYALVVKTLKKSDREMLMS